MARPAKHSADGRRFWRLVVARALVVVMALALLAPHLASDAADGFGSTSAAIAMTADGAGGASGDPADSGLAQHAGCACHVEAPPPAHVTMAGADDLAPGYPLAADAQPRPRPGSLPFKPPRA